MPHKIQVDHIPAGYALHSGCGGDNLECALCEFTSTEDGQLFISRLEGIPQMLIGKLPRELKASASTTDNLLAIFYADKSATVYYNEFYPKVTARAKKDIQKGDLVMLDDISDIDRISLDGIDIPQNAGICYVFSFGWRKGFFYDFSPLQTGEHHCERTYDLGTVLADCWARVLFQERFSVSEAAWEQMFRQRWFPFSSLPRDLTNQIISFAEESRPIGVDIEVFRDHVIEVVGKRLKQWERESAFIEHLPILSAAYERFVAGDDLSAMAILYPRIEGIIRSHQLAATPDAPMKQAQFATSGSGAGHPSLRATSTFLPERFRKYLEEVFFGNFDPKTKPSIASRHTVAHGVAPIDSFNRMNATLGFLTLLQVSTVIRMTADTKE